MDYIAQPGAWFARRHTAHIPTTTDAATAHALCSRGIKPPQMPAGFSGIHTGAGVPSKYVMCPRCEAKDKDARYTYGEVAEEIGGGATLDDLDAAWVAAAQLWAGRNGEQWPPAPASSGWQVTVWSF